MDVKRATERVFSQIGLVRDELDLFALFALFVLFALFALLCLWFIQRFGLTEESGLDILLLTIDNFMVCSSNLQDVRLTYLHLCYWAYLARLPVEK